MHRVALAALLTALSWPVAAAQSDADAALARLGPLEKAGDFAGIERLLRPFEASGNAQVEYYLAFARMNLAIDGKKPDGIRPGDVQPVIRLAQRAARHGSREAWNLLYMIHGNGWGVPVRKDKALDALQRGVAAGDPGAKFNYAIQLYQGSPLVARDIEAACPLFDELARAEGLRPVVAYYEGLIRFHGQCGRTADRAAGMELIRVAADHGVRAAERDLGKHHEFGWTTPVDPALAAAWYAKAAGRGDPEAEWRLGMAYVGGWLGKPRDYAQARRYFESAAASGYAPAMTDLGSMLADGEGVPRDVARAKALYDQGAVAGDARAFRELAILHAQGEGVPVDLVAARVSYLQGLQAGMAEDPQVRQLIESRLTPEQREASQRRFEQGQGRR